MPHYIFYITAHDGEFPITASGEYGTQYPSLDDAVKALPSFFRTHLTARDIDFLGDLDRCSCAIWNVDEDGMGFKEKSFSLRELGPEIDGILAELAEANRQNPHPKVVDDDPMPLPPPPAAIGFEGDKFVMSRTPEDQAEYDAWQIAYEAWRRRMEAKGIRDFFDLPPPPDEINPIL